MGRSIQEICSAGISEKLGNFRQSDETIRHVVRTNAPLHGLNLLSNNSWHLRSFPKFRINIYQPVPGFGDFQRDISEQSLLRNSHQVALDQF